MYTHTYIIYIYIYIYTYIERERELITYIYIYIMQQRIMLGYEWHSSVYWKGPKELSAKGQYSKSGCDTLRYVLNHVVFKFRM